LGSLGVDRGGRRHAVLDGLGICASFLCMAHCLLVPLVLAALPSLAGALDRGAWFHAIMLAGVLPIGAVALIGGWKRHRTGVPLLMGAMGLGLMAAGVALPVPGVLETGLTVIGSLALAAAHVGNWRARRCVSACTPTS